MDGFVTGGQKRSCNEGTTDESLRGSANKRMNLEAYNDEGMKDEEDEFSHPVPWQKIEAEGLDCDYALLFTNEEADLLFAKLEEEVMYLTGRLY